MANQIFVPSPMPGVKNWTITAPWLKLSLKYGIIGPWSGNNWSVAFDRFSLSRGPKTGPPLLTDFAMTALMNSRVNGDDLANVEAWLRVMANQEELLSVAALLAQCEGIHAAPDATLAALGAVMDRITEIRGIKTAKVAKWFCAWAPAHVPMIDQWVREAITGKCSGPPWHTWSDMLLRYQKLVTAHLPQLQQLGERLAADTVLPLPVPPVRVLDGLLWFDWCAVRDYEAEFGQWVKFEHTDNGFQLTELGDEYERSFVAARSGNDL